MGNIKAINAELDLVGQLESIAQAYEEIAILNIKKTREQVVSMRRFLTDISHIYRDVKYSHEATLVQMVATSARENTKLSENNEKRVSKLNKKPLAVLLTPNAKMYGEIVKQVFEQFYEHVSHNDCDVAIIGRIGLQLYEERTHKQPLYFDIPDFSSNDTDLKPVLYHILGYQQVVVFHGKYQTVITQRPTVSHISGYDVFQDFAQTEGESAASEPYKPDMYYFEPSLEAISDFFGDQFFSVMFRQSLQEAHLAQFASRLRAMEQALEYIGKEQKSLHASKSRIERRQQNKKQIERLASIVARKNSPS